MKLNIAYLLLLLVISPNLYGSEKALPIALQEDGRPQFTGLTVKGLTEFAEQCISKPIPSKWVKRGNLWENQTAPRERQIATFIILGSNPKDPKDTSVASYTRPFNAYHFIQSRLYSQDLLYTPLKDDAEKISLSTNKTEKIKQFDKTIRSCKSSTSGPSATFAPQQIDATIFDATSKAGYRSQLLEGLITTQEDYQKTQDQGALKRSLVIANALAHEVQKDLTVLALRKKQIAERQVAVEKLKKEIEIFNPTISNEFAFFMSALIDIHQSEDQYFQADEFNTDKEIVDFIFSKGGNKFVLNSRELTTKTKNNTDVTFDFSEFVKKDGRLPVEECGAHARKIYKNWYSSVGEPKEASALRAAHETLMQARKALATTPTTEVDKRLFIIKQIEILQEQRNDLFIKIRENVFEAAKQLTAKDLAAYNNNIDNKERLAYAESYLSDEQSIIAHKEQEFAHNLLYMTQYQRSLNVPTAQVIKQLIGCDSPTADFLAQQVDSMHSDLHNPLLQQHENVEQASDDKGKEKETILSENSPAKGTIIVSKPQKNDSDTEQEDSETEEDEDSAIADKQPEDNSFGGLFNWSWSQKK